MKSIEEGCHHVANGTLGSKDCGHFFYSRKEGLQDQQSESLQFDQRKSDDEIILEQIFSVTTDRHLGIFVEL